MYVLEQGESRVVESADPIGLKVGIVYEADTESQKLSYQRWKCKRESTLTITYLSGGDISTFGGKFIKMTHLIKTQLN